ncbi:hypothetical protein Halar_0514 (plasmid) [halophilic archaeon DL31]|jgi:hypothetical protein|nr:hypothetical protein Halar_0514 [halophilic archaeon DL31]
MSVQMKVMGEGISVNRGVSEGTALQIMEIALDDGANAEEETMTVSLEGDGIGLNRDISETTGVELIDLGVHNGNRSITESDSEESEAQERDRLPEDFFDRLTEKQRVMIEILLKNDEEWMRGKEIRQAMREHYGMDVPDGGRATAGVIAGLTRKYDEELRRDVIDGQWADETHQNAEFRIGDKYREEIEEVLGTDE